MGGRRVLITGVGSRSGTLIASRLEADPGVEYVAGLDVRPAREALRRTEWIEADIRTPEITRVIPRLGVDTIVHNQIVRRPSAHMSERAMHDINVIGSLQLLAACEHAPELETIVVRGSAGIYGAEPQAPQFLREPMTRMLMRSRFQRDVAEIENYFETFARRHERVTCTMLRQQPAIGPEGETQLSRYLRQPACPTYLGFDPRIQVVHEDDSMDAVVSAVRNPVSGPVNVAGEGTIGLGRMIRLAGRLAVPLAGPLFAPLTSAARRAGLSAYSDDLRRLLRFGRAVDTTRLVEEVGFRPRYSTDAAIRDFAR